MACRFPRLTKARLCALLRFLAFFASNVLYTTYRRLDPSDVDGREILLRSPAVQASGERRDPSLKLTQSHAVDSSKLARLALRPLIDLSALS